LADEDAEIYDAVKSALAQYDFVFSTNYDLILLVRDDRRILASGLLFSQNSSTSPDTKFGG